MICFVLSGFRSQCGSWVCELKFYVHTKKGFSKPQSQQDQEGVTMVMGKSTTKLWSVKTWISTLHILISKALCTQGSMARPVHWFFSWRFWFFNPDLNWNNNHTTVAQKTAIIAFLSLRHRFPLNEHSSQNKLWNKCIFYCPFSNIYECF